MSSVIGEPATFDGLVALPAYNEAAALPGLIEAIAAILPPRCAILVVDDGSADDTAAIAERAAGKFPVMLVRHGRNRGLSAAVRTILRESVARVSPDGWFAVMDADATHDPRQVIEQMHTAERTGADVVVCSRFVPGASVVGVPWWRGGFTAASRWFYRLLVGPLPARDLSCGYRWYRAACVRRAFDTWGDDLVTTQSFGVMVELITKLAWSGAKVAEIPIRLRYDQKHGLSHMRLGPTTGDFLWLLWRLREFSRTRGVHPPRP